MREGLESLERKISKYAIRKGTMNNEDNYEICNYVDETLSDLETTERKIRRGEDATRVLEIAYNNLYSQMKVDMISYYLDDITKKLDEVIDLCDRMLAK